MTHYEVEVLYDTTFKAACGVYAKTAKFTKDEKQVTCKKCWKAMGLEVV